MNFLNIFILFVSCTTLVWCQCNTTCPNWQNVCLGFNPINLAIAPRDTAVFTWRQPDWNINCNANTFEWGNGVTWNSTGGLIPGETSSSIYTNVDSTQSCYVKWRNSPPYTVNLDPTALQAKILQLGGWIRFNYTYGSNQRCSISFRLSTMTGDPSPQAPTPASTFPPIPTPQPSPPSSVPQISNCDQIQKLVPQNLNIALRTYLRQIVGKPQCDLDGLWSNNEISIAFGGDSKTNIMWIRNSNTFVVGTSSGAFGTFVISEQTCIGSPCPFLCNSSGTYNIISESNQCDKIHFELVSDNCTARKSFLSNLTLNKDLSVSPIKQTCSQLPGVGQEIFGNPATSAILIGPSSSALFVSFTTPISWIFSQVVIQNATNGNLMYVQDLASKDQMKCSFSQVGVYNLSCGDPIFISLVSDSCDSRSSMFSSTLGSIVVPLNSSTPIPSSAANGGFGFDMWASIVDRDGIVCAVAYSGDTRDSQWPGSRVISAQKAYTANAFSLPNFALSTANLFRNVQDGQSLYGLQFSNPVNAANAYPISIEETEDYGTLSDPMIGKIVGGVNVFGGGLALYSCNSILGGIGVSGDTSCADHAIAWKLRNALGLDYVPAGPNFGDNGETNDNIIYNFPFNSFSQPHCLSNQTEDEVKSLLPTTRTFGNCPQSKR